MQKVFIVQNPVAGTQSSDVVTGKIKAYLEEKGWEYTFHFTDKQEDVAAVVNSAVGEGYDLFLAVGGDGTVSMVATGLKATSLPLAILPAGTGNGLARDLHIPLTLDEAIPLLGHPESVRALDAMMVNDQYFLLNLSVGLTPLALKESKREQKRKLGRLTYFLAGFKTLFGFQPVTFSLSIDGERRTFRASEVLLMNSVTLGDPGKFLELDINPDDGVLDLFVIQSKNIFDYLRVFWNVLLRRTRHDPDVERFAVKDSLVISGGKFLEVQADGELIGYTPVTVKLLPRAVQVIVPKDK